METSVMPALQKWYLENAPHLEGVGFVFLNAPSSGHSYVGGYYEKYHFMIIDYGNNGVDFEVVNSESGDVVVHNMGSILPANDETFASAITFLIGLGKNGGS